MFNTLFRKYFSVVDSDSSPNLSLSLTTNYLKLLNCKTGRKQLHSTLSFFLANIPDSSHPLVCCSHCEPQLTPLASTAHTADQVVIAIITTPPSAAPGPRSYDICKLQPPVSTPTSLQTPTRAVTCQLQDGPRTQGTSATALRAARPRPPARAARRLRAAARRPAVPAAAATAAPPRPAFFTASTSVPHPHPASPSSPPPPRCR